MAIKMIFIIQMGLISMNKHDAVLVIALFLISILCLFLIKNINSNEKEAYVYYEDKLMLTIDLNVNKEYKVKGYNGNVIIEVRNKKIRVKEEESPLHLCSKQGFSESSFEPIICLPNKIIIKLKSKSELDAVIK
jgi:hypothetical protein